MPRSEREWWRRWLKDADHRPVDAFAYPGDPVPSIVSNLRTTWDCVRHPREFVRTFMQ